MIKRWISCLLIALIACQSVMAMADIHQSHQSGVEHLEFDHDDNPDVTRNNLTADDLSPVNSTTGSAYDCHHCCHSHTMSHLFLSSNDDYLQNIASKQSPPSYQLAYLSNIQRPNFRPPIV